MRLAGDFVDLATSSEDAPELTPAAVAALEERLDEFLANPETGIIWEELKTKKRAS